MRTLTLAVPKPPPTKTLDAFLAAQPGLADGRAEKLLLAGNVRIAGKLARSGRKLWGGETIDVQLPPPVRAPFADTAGPPLPLLFRDDALVVVDKPADLVTDHESGKPSVESLLAGRFGGFDVAGLDAPGVVHRLDRGTTGCLAFGCTDAAVAALLAGFEGKSARKRYLALVHGDPPDDGHLETPYARHPDDPRRYTTTVASHRRAKLFWNVVERVPGGALLDVTLLTGRTHQVRAQLSDAGFPLLGDDLYARADSKGISPALAFGRPALHARLLTLAHPTTGEPVTFDAPLPDDFATALARLRHGPDRTATEPA